MPYRVLRTEQTEPAFAKVKVMVGINIGLYGSPFDLHGTIIGVCHHRYCIAYFIEYIRDIACTLRCIKHLYKYRFSTFFAPDFLLLQDRLGWWLRLKAIEIGSQIIL